MANTRTNGEQYRYTNFPNLHDIAEPSSDLELDKICHEFWLPEKTQRDAVISSWALLLRGYTGASTVVFGVDDRAVCVDFENKTVEDVAVLQSPEGVARETAILFTELQTNAVFPAIYLQVDLDASNASLVASAFMLPGTQVPGLISQFQNILSYQPTSPSSSVPPFTVNAQHRENLSGISVLNPDFVKIPGPELLHELVGFSDHHNHHTSDPINAIEFLAADGRRTGLSYERLHSLSNHIAKDIDAVIDRSAGRKSIPVLLPQSPLLYVALLAILKSGAAFVPLNLDTPEERIRFVVEDVEASVIITNSHFSNKFNWENAPTILKLDEDGDFSNRERWPCHPEKIPMQIAPTDPAYIMYTSGSTGKPKGVIVSHSAASQSLLAHNRHIPQFHRFLQFAAPTFDVSVFEIFFPLFRGCTLVGCDRGRLLADLPQVINEMNIDGAELTPTVAGEILGKRELVPGLKVLLTIGEMLTRRVIDEFGNGVLQGMYGPTEAAIHCTLATNFKRDAKVGDIGIPLDTVSAFVVAPAEGGNSDIDILPVGWVGELVIGGNQLADGYLKRPDITKDVFITSQRWGNLYRTGDRARILPSGRIECLGRVAAGQVKLRGQRVELGEIEEVVLKAPGAKMAVASVVNNSLVIYVSSSEPLHSESVKQLCRRWLPSFMVPSDVVLFEDLPRLPSGKADRKLLDKDYSQRLQQLEGAEDEFLTETEKVVVDTVEEILKFRAAKTQSLSSIGLDSILAIRLATKLRAKGIKVEVLDIISSDTVAGISAAILRTGFIALETGFAQVIWNKPQNTQFAIGGKIEEGNWSVSLEELMTPPFSAQFVTRTNGGNVLSIRIHHAVYDGWSWENILSQFQLLLSGSELASSQHSQFRKVVEWELAYPADRVKAAQSFWSKKLEGVGETRLPNFNGRDVEKSVSVEHAILSTSRLEYEQAARSAGVSPQVLVQSAWSYLLGLYVGKDDIVFGTVVSGRTISLEGIEEIIGPTILTLPVRVQTGLERTMGDVMDDVQKFNRDLLQHTELGLREVRKASGGEVGFDSLLVWQQTANDTVNGAVEFSLLIEAEPKAEEIHLRVTFKEEILPRAQVTMILKQLDRIVQATTENPRQKLRDILPTIEDSLLSIENPAPKLVEASSTRTLATCFEEASSKYPDNLALEFASDIRDGNAQTTKVTFSTLNASANQLARELIERGTFPDDLVVVCMEKSVHCYVSILAVVKAGAGYLPLTADTPPERVKQIISNAGDVRMLNVENIDISKHSIHNPDVSVPARSLGYAVFTSGSTGVPKGVLVEHEQAVGMLDTLADIYPTAPGKRMLQFCSIAFDVSVFEIFFTWARGMCLCSGTKDVILRDIESFINVLQVTHLSMTPTVAALVNPENVPGVEFLVTAGEAVTKKVFNDWAGRGLYQGYGPSETTNICSVLPRVQTTDNISNIGPPFVNTSAFVVVADDTSSLTLLPRGSVGELCFGGVQVCRGYLRMPELTSAKFVTHPKFGRIYRSGDIGRLLPSGEILIQGRLDDQVKIRGNRIELGEITSVILKQSAVLDATTLVISNKALAPQLVAFVAMKEHMDTEFRVVNENESSLQKHLATLFETIGQLLPGYMVPNAIVPLSVIPMTSQGKTDKKLLQRTFLNLSSNSLERFSSGATSQDNTSRKEWTETEKIIASVLAAVAQVNFHEITRNTSIYKLGLDSISAIHLSTRLGKCGFARPDVSQIMRNPTDIDEILPCTPLQEAMLSTKKGADPRGYYNHTICRHLSTSLQALGQAAWARILAVYTSESDICFGNVVSGRTVPVEGVEKMVAPCFNTVPIRVQVLDTSTNLSIMESLQKVNADIIPHQLTPLRRIMSQRLDDLWEELEDRGEMDFSIVMELVPSHARDALEVVVHYRRDVLLDEQIEVLLNQFDAMVKSSLMNSQGLALNFDTFDSEIMSEANRNPTYLTSNGPGLLHSELERLAQEVPNHTALEWLDKEEQNSSWTFGEINRASNQIAHHLISLDVRRDEAIPLCIEKSPLYYICVIAVLKAGCAFTPIDPSLPEQRKAFMIKELDVQVIDIESLSSLSEQPTVNPVVQDLSEICLAYRLYTSGSTGQPKAVSMEHRSAIQTIRQSKSIIPWTSESRMLQFAATTFDMCYYDLFMAWSYGFTLCSATAGHLLGDLERTISRMNISILDLTPTVASTINAETLPGVKLLYCIGEAMPSKIVDSWLGRCVNSYGPTEAAMCCTITDVRSEIKAANIGYPFDTTKFAVLSKVSPTVLPIFAAGELCIGGHQLAREYHNNPELTASRFIKHKEETLYRTGDIVRQLPNGTFEFIGRADDQVKIRGLRVELDEISTVLRGSHESIRDTTTMVLKYSTDSKNQLVSFLALEDRKQHGTPPKVCSSDSVVKIARNVAQKMLPRYMVPGIMLVIDHMPLSAAGKVDKKTLGALFREQDIKSLSQHTNSETQEKWSENEQKMREVFSVISQVPVEQIHKGSTIYELGLDSISATQVALKLKREGLNISVLDILEHRSIIATNTNGMPVTVYPCTGAQEGMISQFLRSQGELYFNHIIFKLPADLNTDKLHNAWQQQKKIGATEALKNLHLPPWRLTLIQSESQNYLLFSGLHALYDATTLQIFYQDVAKFYHCRSIPERPQFGNILEEILRHRLDSNTVEEDKRFWLNQLEGSSICRMPNLCPQRTASKEYHVRSIEASWGLSEIEATCQKLGVSVHAAAQAAWARILSAYTGETALTMGVVFSGRTALQNAEDVAFPCLVTLPAVVALIGSNRQLAVDIQKSNTAALKHQHTPLRSIQRWFEHPEESFFDSLFVYQKTAGEDESRIWNIVNEDASADYAFSLEIEPTMTNKVLIRATAADNTVPSQQTELMIRQIDAALLDILKNPDRAAADLSSIPAELLSVTPAIIDEIPCETKLLHKFVEKHRELSPDKLAFEFVTAIDEDNNSESEIHTASFETPVITDLTPDNLSYCLYTSGTTGTPKGCELTHENAVQAMLAFQRLFAGHWDADSKWLQFASFHFDVSVLEQYWSWSVGICVTSAPRDLIFQDLAGTIDTLQITHLDLTPSLAALLSPEDVPSLCRGVFITGGEALKQEILDKWGETGVIYNGYGPTEVTIGCTMYPRVPANGKPSNIGPQFDNVGSYVFAPGTERPVPRGAIGELCASGKLVGRGYLNRPDLTNEKFPLLKEYNERIYRTGDLVRILHDGTFDFTGRADDQVKLRGQRLEIGEINEVVKKAPNAEIQAVTTLVLRHPKQQKDQLVSFVILGSESEIPTERGITPFVRTGSEHAKIISHLVAACKTKLPTYMVPTHFLPVSHMPLSINNKVDNKSLKALYEATTLDVLQRLSRVEEDKGDWNDAEKKLRDVLMHITGLQSDEIRRSSTIFELGLDSVAVVGLARRLNRSGFTGASPSLLLQNPVLSHMANMLSQASDSSSEGNARLQETRQKIGNFALDNLRTITQQLNVDRDSIANILQCTSLQEGMIARFLDSDKPLYFNSFPMLLKSTTDITALKKAWETVAASADILRTCFCETEDGYAQVILKNAALRWDKVELNDGSEDFEEAVRQGLQRSIDSNRDLHLPPISILLITSSTKVMLSLNIFHAIYDGTSLPIILNDIAKAYSGTFGVRTIQFGDVIPHLLTMQEGAKEFWQQNIKVSNSLPLDQLRGVSEPQDYSIEVSLSNNSAHIDDICKKLQCTAQAIFQAAWACALSTYIGRQVTLGVVVSGRSLSIEDIENVIGPTFNTIPCSVDVEAISWENIIGAIQAFNSGSIPFHNTPLRMIHKWLKRTSEQPLFDTLFVYQKGSVEEQGKEKLLWELCSGSTVADYPLSLEVAQAASGQINVTIVAKADLSREKVSRILQNFQNQLNRLLSNPRSAPLVQSETIEYENKVQDVGSKSSSNFEWNEQACILRKTIAKLSEVGEDKIDADSSILELGLDSIEAIKLSSRLRRHGIKISVSTIMRNTTIRKMQFAIGCENTETTSTTGNQLIATFENAARKQLENLKHVKDVESIYPTTPLQEAMIAETLASDYALYFNHDVLKLDARIDLQRLKIAWATVVRQSEILRTSFFALQNSRNQQTYGQLVHQFFNPEVTEFIVPEQNKVLGAIDDLMQQIKARADLLSEPPVYLSLVKGPEHTYLILSISHALYDGWSIGLLHKDLKQAYFGALKQRPSPRMLIENIFNTDARGSRDFWGQLLKGAVTSQFPTASETPNTADGTYRFERVCSISFSEVQAFCKTINTTVQSLGKACWGLLLAHLLGETDVLFGTVLSGRDFDPAEDIMFPAMNTVPVRVDLRGSYREVLQKLQDQGSMILKYQYTPLREIQKLVSTGGNRLFDTLFLYQPTQSTLEEDNSLYASVGGSSHVEYNVAVEMERCEEKIVWRNACKSTALNQTTAEAILESLDSLLAHIVRNPEHPALSFKESGMVIGNLPATQRRAQHTLNGIRIDLEEADKIYCATAGANWTPLEGRIRGILAKIAGLPEQDIQRTQTIFHIGLDSISAIRLSSDLRKAGILLSVADILREATIERMALAAKSSKNISTLTIDTKAVMRKALERVDVSKDLTGLSENQTENILPVTSGQLYMLSAWRNSGYTLFMPTFTFTTSTPVELNHVQTAWESLIRQQPILRTSFRFTGNEDTFLFLTIHHALYDGVSLQVLLSKLTQLLENRPSRLPTPDPEEPKFPEFVALAQVQDLAKQQKFWSTYLSGAQSNVLSWRQSRHLAHTRSSCYNPRSLAEAKLLESKCNHAGLSLQSLVFGIYLSNRHFAIQDLASMAAPTLNLVPLRIRGIRATKRLVDLARRVQDDLVSIGTVENSVVNLKSIERWTGVTMDCFFNFIKLPGQPGASKPPSPSTGSESSFDQFSIKKKILLEEVDLAAEEMLAPAEVKGFLDTKTRDLDNIRTHMDIEVAVRGNCVDIGAFANAAFFREDELKELISEICSVVGEV
ncbi:hypothetical protein EDC01DRAFT_617399 [Geopyxis carbonaria]|nr:hypothetical protein EDC01DRAFT_617399 [Geopyxis carbonaria]